MVKIAIENLYKSFGDNNVLRGLNLEVNEGEIFCIIGKSGTGKSVIMKHLVGMIEPDSGTIKVDGELFTNSEPSVKRAIIAKYGILFQGAALFDSMNIYDNVAFGLRRKGVAEELIAPVVEESLYNVGLAGAGEFFPSDLSGGMQKRAALARSVAVKPQIMIYDEPTTGVDPITGGAVNRLIMRMRELYHITTIVVTHDMNSAFRIADRIAMLYEGSIIETGSGEEIKNSDNPYVRQFVEGTVNGPIKVI